MVSVESNIKIKFAEVCLADCYSKVFFKKVSRHSVSQNPNVNYDQWQGVADMVNDYIDQNEDVDRAIPNLGFKEVFVDPELPEVSP